MHNMRMRDHGLGDAGHLYGSEKVGESEEFCVLICFFLFIPLFMIAMNAIKRARDMRTRIRIIWPEQNYIKE